MVSKKKLNISSSELNTIKPITDNQKEVFASYEKGQNLFLYGVAGTGKTFVALYNALKDVLDPKSPRERVYIVRSLLPTRDIGFLPGDEEDKSYLYQVPYQNMVRFIVDECQNLNFHELDTIMTRIGQNTRIVFAGDIQQTDLTKTNDRNGILDFVNIMQQMKEVDCIEFDLGDIVRSGVLKSYLIEKIKMGLHYEQ
jgi:predicted ribonuclease YlaK